MTYQPKIVKCRMKTGGKSIEKIRERCKGQGMVYRDFENIQRAEEQLNGLTLILSLWDYDKHESYHMHNWEPADDEHVMMAIYYYEQIRLYTQYKNNLEKFKQDWAAGEYDPGCALCFDPADVEEIEVLSEEVIPPKSSPSSPPPQKRKKKKRHKK